MHCLKHYASLQVFVYNYKLQCGTRDLMSLFPLSYVRTLKYNGKYIPE